MLKTERISVEEWNKRRMNGILSGEAQPSASTEPTRKKPVYNEEKLQKECVAWFDNAFPNIAPLLFHPANGGKRTATEAKIFRAMGVRAGIPDLFLLIPRKGFSFLSIEMKWGKGKQSTYQEIMEEMIKKKSGGEYVVCTSLAQFKQIINSYMHD